MVGATSVVPWRGERRPTSTTKPSRVAPRLAALGLGDGDLVLDRVAAVPGDPRRAVRAGRGHASARCTRRPTRRPFDAFRTASLVRQLAAAGRRGRRPPVLDGLAELGRDLGEVFGTGRRSSSPCDDDAARRPSARRRRARPAVARARRRPARSRAPDDDAFVYDADRWQVDERRRGELLLTNLVRPAHPVRPLRAPACTGSRLRPADSHWRRLMRRISTVAMQGEIRLFDGRI